MPDTSHPIPLRTTDLDAYATPNVSRLKPLFLLLFSLIFKASKA